MFNGVFGKKASLWLYCEIYPTLKSLNLWANEPPVRQMLIEEFFTWPDWFYDFCQYKRSAKHQTLQEMFNTDRYINRKWRRFIEVHFLFKWKINISLSLSLPQIIGLQLACTILSCAIFCLSFYFSLTVI